MGADGGGVCKRQIPATIPSHDFGRSGEEVHIDEARLNVGTASHVYADGILLSNTPQPAALFRGESVQVRNAKRVPFDAELVEQKPADWHVGEQPFANPLFQGHWCSTLTASRFPLQRLLEAPHYPGTIKAVRHKVVSPVTSTVHVPRKELLQPSHDQIRIQSGADESDVRLPYDSFSCGFSRRKTEDQFPAFQIGNKFCRQVRQHFRALQRGWQQKQITVPQ